MSEAIFLVLACFSVSLATTTLSSDSLLLRSSNALFRFFLFLVHNLITEDGSSEALDVEVLFVKQGPAPTSIELRSFIVWRNLESLLYILKKRPNLHHFPNITIDCGRVKCGRFGIFTVADLIADAA